MKNLIILLFIWTSFAFAQENYTSRVKKFEYYLQEQGITFENPTLQNTQIESLLLKAEQEHFGDEEKKSKFIDKAMMILNDSDFSPLQQFYLPLRILYSIYADDFAPSEYDLQLFIDIAKGKRIKIKKSGKESSFNINQVHPAWTATINKNRWQELESFFEAGLSHTLETKYKLQDAQRVLFFSKIKDTATNPKITAKDAFGVKWKLKWGREVFTEPVANRLYLNMGGKFTDLVYAHPAGNKGVTLILEDNSQKGSCEHVNTIALFKSCLLKSKYKFRIDEFIEDSGIITEENAQSILSSLPHGKKKYRTKNLYGRTYVTFKSSITEFQGEDVLIRGGPVPFSLLGTEYDDVAKSLIVFNLLIANMDNKDQNNRNALLYNPIDEQYEYVEYQHDNGASFGQMRRPRDLNAFTVGNNFFKKKKNKLIFKVFRYYKPKLWNSTSAEEAKNMARSLLQLSDQDIDMAVSSIPWPNFMQATFAYKLKQRRNDLLFAFELSEEDIQIPVPNISFDLSSPEAITKISKEFQIPQRELQMAAQQGHIEDSVIKKGEIVSCEKSIIINLLEKHRFPSGLERNLRGKWDFKPLSNCKFKP